MSNEVSMPIGVPQPIVNFSEELPAWPESWERGGETIGYFYVNARHENATDTGNNYGTPDKPRATLPYTLPAGSLIVLRGVYDRDQAGKSWLRCAGTNDEWVAGKRGKVYVDGGIGEDDYSYFTYHVAIHGEYFLIDGITLANERRLNIGSSTAGYYCGYGTLRNSNIEGTGGGKATAVAISAPFNTEGSKTEHFVFWKNSIHKYGPWLDNKDDVDANGMNIAGDVQNIWILDNYIGETAGSGIQLSPGKPSVDESSTRFIYIARNEVSYCSQGGITGKYPRNTVISQNHIHHVYDRWWTPSKGIGMQYGPKNIWMLYNLIEDCRYGVRGAGTDSTDTGWFMYSIGNIIINANRSNEEGVNFDESQPYNNACAFVSQGYYQWYIGNNLVVNSEAFFTTVSYSDTYRLQNNIAQNITEATFVVYSSTPLKRTVNNIIGNAPNLYRITGDDYKTANELSAYIGNNTNIMETLANTAGLSTEEIIEAISNHSSLVDAGYDLPEDVYNAFNDTFGFPLVRGYYDKVVPQGGGLDIGPWESGNEFVDIIPAAPTDLYIDVLEKAIYWTSASLNAEEYVIYKDGLEFARVTADKDNLVIDDINTSVNKYSVAAVNATGSSVSSEIESASISVEEFTTMYVESDKSHKVFRTAIEDTHNMVISDVSSTGTLYGASYPDAKISNSAELSTGYIYSLSNDTLTGSIQGSGSVSIYLCASSYVDYDPVYEFVVGDNILRIHAEADGFMTPAYRQYKFTIEITNELEYSFFSSSEEGKGHCGLIGIIEN